MQQTTLEHLPNKDLLGRTLFLLGILFIFSAISRKLNVNIVFQEKFMWYVTCNHWVLLSLPSPEELSSCCRFRPLFFLFCNRLFPLGLFSFIFVRLQAHSLYFSPHFFFWLLTLGVLAGTLSILIQMTLQLGFSYKGKNAFLSLWIYQKLLFLLGGLFLPLSIYPSWLELIASYTPFSTILSDRSQLIFSCDLSSVSHILLSLVGWGLFFLGGLFYFHKKLGEKCS